MAGGEVSELFEFVEAAVNQVAVPVGVGVESGGRPLAESSAFRWMIWPGRSGRVNRMRRSRNEQRVKGWG